MASKMVAKGHVTIFFINLSNKVLYISNILAILSVEPIYPQYSGVLERCLELRYWLFEVLGSESVNFVAYVKSLNIDYMHAMLKELDHFDQYNQII